MTIKSVQQQEATAPEKRALTVQNELQKDVLKDTMDGNVQKQLLQMLANTQPPQQIRQVAQTQINKGFLDIRI